MEETNVTSMVKARRNFILRVQSSYSVKMCIPCGYLLFAVAYLKSCYLTEEDKDIVMVFLISLSHKITFNKIFRSDILCPSKKLVVVFVMSCLGLKLLCICMFRIYIIYIILLNNEYFHSRRYSIHLVMWERYCCLALLKI